MPKTPAPVEDRKRCRECELEKPLDGFPIKRRNKDGRGERCLDCKASKERERYDERRAKQDEEDAARVERLASDFAALKPGDLDDDVSVGNDGRRDAKASKEKRQEYSRSMGEFGQATARAARAQANGQGTIADNMPPELGTYIGKLAEQERRFGNRRIARSVSLYAAQEALSLHQFKLVAAEYLRDRIVPTGYAAKRAATRKKRSACLLLSDLHFGAELDSLDEPMPFRAIEEARRLEFVLRQLLDYKPQYRADTEAVVLLNGDVIEGQLEHSPGGAPLAEQKAIFWRYMRQFIGHVAAEFPTVRVVCQGGNHGRDLVRHKGRATSRKWDGHEFECYFALREMASELRNVSWQIDFRAASLVNLHGQNLLLSHGDTEVKVGHPDKTAERNMSELHKRSASRIDGGEFTAAAFGHFHTARYHPGRIRVIYNGALVPPNGYARGIGAVVEDCGQYLWEAVEGHPIGDLRYIEVGRAQDRDEKLGKMITPFRFSDSKL